MLIDTSSERIAFTTVATGRPIFTTLCTRDLCELAYIGLKYNFAPWDHVLFFVLWHSMHDCVALAFLTGGVEEDEVDVAAALFVWESTIIIDNGLCAVQAKVGKGLKKLSAVDCNG